MAEEFNNLGGDFTEDDTPPPPRNNRTLLIAAGTLGSLFLLALIGLVVYALIIAPQLRARQAAQLAQVGAQQTVTALAFTQAAGGGGATVLPKAPTITPSPSATATSRPIATITPVIELATRAPIIAPTEAAVQTATTPAQTQTALLPAPTVLPATGLADEVGIPGLLGLAIGLIGVIFIARRLRA